MFSDNIRSHTVTRIAQETFSSMLRNIVRPCISNQRDANSKQGKFQAIESEFNHLFSEGWEKH